MPAASTTILQVRVDTPLKQAFADAARREHTTPSQALRNMVENYVRDSFRKEAERQSRLVAQAPDAEETMDEIMRLQAWAFD